MSYALTKASLEAIERAIAVGGTETLLLIRPAAEVQCALHIERDGERLEATLTHGAVTHTLRLPAADSASPHHLAEWALAIANGVADTAEAPPLRQGVFDRLTGAARVTDPLDLAPLAAEFNCAELEALLPQQHQQSEHQCTCPSGDGSLRWPCPVHTEKVDHPPHYNGHPSGVECIEVAEHLPFCLGNAFKYLFRRDTKGERRQNLEKALWYIRREEAARADGVLYMISEESGWPLAKIIAHEPAPYRYIMEMVGTGRMLDLAADMLADEIALLDA